MTTLLSTAGVDYKSRVLVLDDKHVQVQVWDTAGQERFHVITHSYYRGCNAILLVCVRVWWVVVCCSSRMKRTCQVVVGRSHGELHYSCFLWKPAEPIASFSCAGGGFVVRVR